MPACPTLSPSGCDGQQNPKHHAETKTPKQKRQNKNTKTKTPKQKRQNKNAKTKTPKQKRQGSTFVGPCRSCRRIDPFRSSIPHQRQRGRPDLVAGQR
jgi:hypothetical protein